MPTFSSSINKSGLKRVAPKAPPRRTIRRATTPNAGSYRDGSASQNQSVQGTPDPQAAQDDPASIAPFRSDVHLEHSSGSHTRRDGASAESAFLENSVESAATPAPSTASSRITKAPTVISTAPQQDTPPDAEVQASTEVSADKAKFHGRAQKQKQTRAGSRSSEAAKRSETSANTETTTVGEGDTTSRIPPKLPKRRLKAVQEIQSAENRGSAAGETSRPESDQAPEQDNSNAVFAQAPAEKRPKSKPRISPAQADGVQAQSPTPELHDSQATNPRSTRSRSTRKRKRTKTAQEAAGEIVEEATVGANGGRGQVSGKKRKRKMGSEEAENHEIVPAEVKMADLVKDLGLGKTSKRETEMQKIDWLEVKKKRREAEEEAIREEQKQKEARKNGRPLPPPGPLVAERLVIVNGQMVIDESSRVIDRNAATARDADELGEAIDEDRLTKRINQATVGRKPGAVRTYSTWDDEETEQFYQGLRMFGTDFMMISKMFPGTSRAMIKKKFSKEEKLNPEKILTALNSKEPVDLKAFSEMTDTVYEDPRDFYKELEEEQARLEAEDAKMRADEAQVDQEIQESIEQPDEVEGTDGEHPEREGSRRKNRFDADARSIVDAADSRQKKSKKTPTAKNRQGRKGKGVPAEGTEEMVGRIEDIDPI